jgi:hypothetical protein
MINVPPAARSSIEISNAVTKAAPRSFERLRGVLFASLKTARLVRI